jgi:hypothetical protein
MNTASNVKISNNCLRCVVLNDADASAPRCKRERLDATAEFFVAYTTGP